MGGLAFKSKTRRILREEIPETLQWVNQHVGIPLEYLHGNLLGSAGKSSSSGDLDINVDETRFDKQVILERLNRVLPEDQLMDRTSVNQIFTCVPIRGKPQEGFVQIDFMFGNRKWQEFSYWSPGDRSSYKGLFRTELLKAATAFQSDWVHFENYEMVARVGPTFFHDRGIVWRYRERPLRKDRNGRIKTLVQLDEETFLKHWPSAKKASSTTISSPSETSELIFGNPNRVDLFDSYESLSGALRPYYGRKSFGIIMGMFEERLNSLKAEIPKAIQDEISTAIRAKY